MVQHLHRIWGLASSRKLFPWPGPQNWQSALFQSLFNCELCRSCPLDNAVLTIQNLPLSDTETGALILLDWELDTVLTIMPIADPSYCNGFPNCFFFSFWDASTMLLLICWIHILRKYPVKYSLSENCLHNWEPYPTFLWFTSLLIVSYVLYILHEDCWRIDQRLYHYWKLTLKNLRETNNLFDSCRKWGDIWEVDIRPGMCLKRKDIDVNLCINHIYMNCDVL